MATKEKIKVKYAELNIREIEESPLNANQQTDTVFKRLVNNLKKDGTLTSAILVMEKGEKYMCISGHHRIRAAIKAGIKKVPALIIPEVDRSTQVRLQLSHNDISGENNKEILAEIIKDLEKEDYEFIDQDDLNLSETDAMQIEIPNVDYKYINFCVLPETKQLFDDLLMVVDTEADNYFITLADYERLKEMLTIAFRSGFKSNGLALSKFIEVARNHINEMK